MIIHDDGDDGDDDATDDERDGKILFCYKHHNIIYLSIQTNFWNEYFVIQTHMQTS